MQEFNKNILGHVHTTNNFLQKKCFPKQNGNERESYECFLLFINFHFYQIDCNMLYYVKLGLGVFLGEIIAAEVKPRWPFSVLVMRSVSFLQYDTTQSVSVSMHFKKKINNNNKIIIIRYYYRTSACQQKSCPQKRCLQPI